MIESHHNVLSYARDYATRKGGRVRGGNTSGKRGSVILEKGSGAVVINYDLPLSEAHLRAEIDNLVRELLTE